MRRVIVCIWLLCSGVGVFGQLSVDHLLVENLSSPLGVDVAMPRFTWRVNSTLNEVLQTAYEIRVERGGKIVWQSGKVLSGQSVLVGYRGDSLMPQTRYEWQVRVWDNQGHASGYSARAFFVTGMMGVSNWKAKWIEPGYVEDSLLRPCPVLQKSFVSRSTKIVSAYAFVTAHGMYEWSLNGKRVGDGYYTPGWTSYGKRLQYQVYDVRALLAGGENAIQVTLASGWYRGVLAWEGKRDHYGKKLALLFQLEIRYADGSVDHVLSDGSWQSGVGKIVSSEIYDGEVQDGRLNVRMMAPVSVVDHGYEHLIASVSQPVRKQEVFGVRRVLHTPAGETVLDFGQNLVGFVQVSVQGLSGDSVRLDHAEILDGAGNFYTKNLRGAKASNVYVLRGDGVEKFAPHFSWQGFRYVRVTGLRGAIDTSQFHAVALYSDMPSSGEFVSSNDTLNQLQHNIQWTMNGNFLEVPTDCPQRDERLGWMGDAQLFSGTAAFNRNVHAFFDKWLGDVRADQLSSGAISDVVPRLFDWGGAAGWADASVILPWRLFERYGDTGLLRRNYAMMQRWVGYLQENSVGGLRKPRFQFGDWLSFRSSSPTDPERTANTDGELVSQAYYVHSLALLVRSGVMLGRAEDVALYSRWLDEAKKAFLSEYVTPNGRLMSNTQTAYVLALEFDILPDSLRAAAARFLVSNIESYDYHLTTGIIGTAYLLPVLSRYGYSSVAYKILMQHDYPSWFYAISKGATTIWERWDGIKADGSLQHWHMKSFNHYALGAVGDWLYQRVLGIRPDSSGVGYQRFVVQPEPGGGLTFVKGTLETYYGKIGVKWMVVEGVFSVEVSVPVNCRARVVMPDGSEREVGSGRWKWSCGVGE